MTRFHARFLAALMAAAVAGPALAQVPVQAEADHGKLLAAADPALAANKRLVYDFWREVLEAGHLELAEKYLAEGYVQHNPNVPTGRKGFVEFFGQFAKPQAIQARVQAPLVAITAEGDRVVLAFVKPTGEKKEGIVRPTTTWFDMFRVEHGKIVEHWDGAQKQP
jgi:predicted SnoaL-like aldol condensation-catalyzing enzyme